MQTATEDLGPEDLTGYVTSGHNGSFVTYVHPDTKPGQRDHVRDALARCRAAALQSKTERHMRGEFVQ